MLIPRRQRVVKLLSFAIIMTICSYITFKYLTWNLHDRRIVLGPSTVTDEAHSTVNVGEPPKETANFTESTRSTGFTNSINLTNSSIPEIIWYKVGPKRIPSETLVWMNEYITKNPTFRQEVLTDKVGDDYVRRHFTARPDIIEAFLGLQVPILKADLLRYLLLFHDGGIWSDLDVSYEETPILDWIPEQLKQKTSLVVGVEFDGGWPEDIIHQFASWTIMAKPQSPHMMMVIEDILEGVQEKTKMHNVTISELKLDMIGDVVDFTGPRRLTNGVMKSLNQIYKFRIKNENFSHVMEPRLLGDVLVMPGWSFANSSNAYVGECGVPLVKHHYAGTWRNPKGEVA